MIEAEFPRSLADLAVPRRLLADPLVILRAATPADAAALRVLYIALRAPEFAAANLPAPMLATLLDGQFRVQQTGYAGRFRDLSTYVATDGEALTLSEKNAMPQRPEDPIRSDSALVGRLMLARESADGAPGLRVVDIALAPAWRGLGLGATILALVETAARAEALAALTLDVAVDNPAARRLYERLGYRALGPAPQWGGVTIGMRKALA